MIAVVKRLSCHISQESCPFLIRFAEPARERGYAARGPGERPVGVEAESVSDVRAPALAHRRHHHLLRVGRKDLVQLLRQRPFLQADVPGLRDLSHRFDQAPCVRLHHVASDPLSARRHDPQCAA